MYNEFIMRIYKLLLIAALFFTFMPSSEIFDDEPEESGYEVVIKGRQDY